MISSPIGTQYRVQDANNISQTQYGNLLRMEPATQSPLLLPANEHKQLVVIDFEYSSANTPGLEFANHFVSIQHKILWSLIALSNHP
jgi:thiamine kinase-like enzyme